MRPFTPIPAIDVLRWAGIVLNGSMAAFGVIMVFVGFAAAGVLIVALGALNAYVFVRFVKMDSETDQLQRELHKANLQREIWEALEKNRESYLREEAAKRDYALSKQREPDKPLT
jgi:membrane protein implicated in regulation of membrane protease activity